MDECLTFTYKSVGNLDIKLDIYGPQISRSDPVPAVVYFHGGGLTVGDRKSWFPGWLHKRLASRGIAFVSADYRLIPSGGVTGKDVLEDIKDAFAFVAGRNFDYASNSMSFRISNTDIAAAGPSAGGLCAYLAGIHAVPRPKALLSMYGMGGDFLSPHYLQLKTAPFFCGRELLDPSDPKFIEFQYTTCTKTPQVSSSPLAYLPLSSPMPGYPANPRMLLARLYLQLGNFLDYYTGDFNTTTIKPKHAALYPQANVTRNWPPTLLVHGEEDTAVPISESRHLDGLLKDAGIDCDLIVVPGCEHSFDYAEGSEDTFSDMFDRIALFLERHLIASY